MLTAEDPCSSYYEGPSATRYLSFSCKKEGNMCNTLHV